MATSVQSVKPSRILASVVTRLRDGLTATLDPTKIRMMGSPDPNWDQFVAESNVGVKFRPPEPYEPAGAGRIGYPVSRIMEVYVATVNLYDQAGTGTLAITGHHDLEDQIINILLCKAPVSADIGNIPVKYAGGGDLPKRLVRDDPGYMASVLLFRFGYLPVVTL